MKFKTVSEFIHALEVEGKRFKHGSDTFIMWHEEKLKPYVFKFGPHDDVYIVDGEYSDFNFNYDFQEYLPEPETEEIELEEWLVGAPFGDHLHPEFHFKGKSPQGSLPSYKTGVTRKVKVPK